VSIRDDQYSKDPNVRAQYHLNETLKGGSGGGGGGNKNGGCFPANTMIHTATGTKPIEAIKPGDQVLAWCPKTETVVPTAVLKLKRHAGLYTVVKTVFEDGQSMTSTPVHSFLTDTGWRRLDRIGVGDRVLSRQGWKIVAKLERLEKGASVYNLVTDKYFTFVADGMVAHNFTAFKSLKIVAWTLCMHFYRFYKRSLGRVSSTGSHAHSSRPKPSNECQIVN
jgi:hypothetical protein